MGSVTINLLDSQTLALLRQLEAMQLSEIVEPRPPVKKIKAEELFGIWSNETAEKFDIYLEETEKRMGTRYLLDTNCPIDIFNSAVW